MEETPRFHKRYKTSQPLRIRCGSWKKFATVYAGDISQGGLFIETEEPPPMLSSVDVEFDLPDGQQMQLEATVVHVMAPEMAASLRRKPGVGVEFRDIEPEVKSEIDRLVQFARRQQEAIDKSRAARQSAERESPPEREAETDRETRPDPDPFEEYERETSEYTFEERPTLRPQTYPQLEVERAFARGDDPSEVSFDQPWVEPDSSLPPAVEPVAGEANEDNRSIEPTPEPAISEREARDKKLEGAMAFARSRRQTSYSYSGKNISSDEIPSPSIPARRKSSRRIPVAGDDSSGVSSASRRPAKSTKPMPGAPRESRSGSSVPSRGESARVAKRETNPAGSYSYSGRTGSSRQIPAVSEDRVGGSSAPARRKRSPRIPPATSRPPVTVSLPPGGTPELFRDALKDIAHKRHDLAIKSLREILAVEPDNREAKKWLVTCRARTLMEKGQREASVALYQTLLDMDEGNREALKVIRFHHRNQTLLNMPFGRYFADKPDPEPSGGKKRRRKKSPR
jgi:uncharacterized protein (TIGR02266 family)